LGAPAFGDATPFNHQMRLAAPAQHVAHDEPSLATTNDQGFHLLCEHGAPECQCTTRRPKSCCGPGARRECCGYAAVPRASACTSAVVSALPPIPEYHGCDSTSSPAIYARAAMAAAGYVQDGVYRVSDIRRNILSVSAIGTSRTSNDVRFSCRYRGKADLANSIATRPRPLDRLTLLLRKRSAQVRAARQSGHRSGRRPQSRLYEYTALVDPQASIQAIRRSRVRKRNRGALSFVGVEDRDVQNGKSALDGECGFF